MFHWNGFREEDIINRLVESLKDLQVPSEIVSEIVARISDDQRRARGKVSNERTFLESRLTAIHNRMDKAYSDKLDGKIAEDFWQLMTEWRMEEQQVKMAIQGLSGGETGYRALDAQKIFELANSAYSLYVSQNSIEKAKLLKMVVSNFSVDAVSVTPTYRKPFDIIAKRAQSEEWSGARGFEPPTPLVPNQIQRFIEVC
jgi:chorismate mutase